MGGENAYKTLVEKPEAKKGHFEDLEMDGKS